MKLTVSGLDFTSFKIYLAKSGGWDPRLFSVVPSDWTRSNGQKLEVPSKYEEKKVYFEADRALKQAAHRGYGVSFCGDIQNLPVQPALNETALVGGLGRWSLEVPSNSSFGDSV